MATQHRQQPSRLHIPPYFNPQLANLAEHRTMYSPILPTASQASFPAPFNGGFVLQTPMQPTFYHNTQVRPPQFGHRPNSASVAHFPPHGIHDQGANMTMTPLGQAGFSNGFQGGHPNHTNAPFIPKSRRTPSMIGGPPKALLGGPNRKPSPLPPAQQALQDKLKAKKVLVKLPKEAHSEDADEENGDEASLSRSLWSRTPVDPSALLKEVDVALPEASTAEIFPTESLTKILPPSVDVFLPGKSAWNEMRERMLDEKLEELGIGNHFASGVSESHAPHARAASISSPADPALLFFKLNKLQQSQAAASSSMIPSPKPLSLSPDSQSSLNMQRHRSSMSLDQHQLYSQHIFNQLGNSEEGVGEETIDGVSSPIAIHAPQGRVPAQLNVPTAPLRASSRPDFIRGFGLDIPEEEEEEELRPMEVKESPLQEPKPAVDSAEQANIMDDSSIVEESEPIPQELPLVHNVHTRHASRVSVTLSLGSPTRPDGKGMEESTLNSLPYKKDSEDVDDAVNEWTGSEDMRSEASASDDESVGEWSNPSDEERARQDRLHRRNLHRLQAEEAGQPRRIPDFPRPPEKLELEFRESEDIISNPSEEDDQPLAVLYHSRRNTETHVFARSHSNNSTTSGRPLPPLPHSRDGSGHFSYRDSIPSHSRTVSEHLNAPLFTSAAHAEFSHALSGSISSRRESLNPFAKPFVFGARPLSTPQSQPTESISSAPGSAPSHSRRPSSHVLNASAQEFKPGGFTFRPPEGIKPLAFPEPTPASPEARRLLPQVPVIGVTHASQGREKRRKVIEDGFTTEFEEDDEDKENRDTMSSFRFPSAPEPTMVFHRSAPASPIRLVMGTLNAAAKPFTFSGFPSSQNAAQHDANPQRYESSSEPHSPLGRFGDGGSSSDHSMPQNLRQKRAPIPLDFKHPVSTNTVPAGLFKSRSHMDMEERVRPRPRVSSLEFSDQRSDFSLDDLSVPAISQKVVRARVVAHDIAVLESPLPDFNDASCPSGRSSKVSGEMDTTLSESRLSRHSNLPPVPPDMEAFGEDLKLEQRLEALLDRKMSSLQDALTSSTRDGRLTNIQTDDLVKEAMAVLRSQLRDSMTVGFDDSRLDTQSSIDFDTIKSVFEQIQEESRSQLQRDIAEFFETIEHTTRQTASDSAAELSRHIQDVKTNVIVSNAHLTERLNAIEASTLYSGSAQEREVLVYDLLNALTPQILALRNEPLDYDGLTLQLSQAVKPHIHQLIDLASDKQETAELIANRLMPILQSLASSPAIMDTENLVSEITATVNRITAPFDTHSIKEEVADLVVERLDSRLAVRDNNLNFDGLSMTISKTLAPVSDQVIGVKQNLDLLLTEHRDLLGHLREDTNVRERARDTNIEGLGSRLQTVAEHVVNIQNAVAEHTVSLSALDRIGALEAMISSVTTNPSTPVQDDFISSFKQFSESSTELKELISSLAQAMEDRHAEVQSLLATGQDRTQEMAKLTSANADLQVQLTKARGAHGQIRVEKDNISQKLRISEKERDELRLKLESLQSVSLSKVAEQAAAEARAVEQDRSLQTALERLSNSDAHSQTQRERIAELEKTNRDLLFEKQQMKSKVESLEMQVDFNSRDKGSATQALKLLQADRDHLAMQQSHWEDLRRTASQMEILTAHITKVENEELQELRRIKERSRLLEGEHAALQKRVKDQDTKIANIQGGSLTARQNLASAQQRSSEWEKKAKEFEGEVERLTTIVEQAEQIRLQLEADCNSARSQAEEREAENRLARDRERKLIEELSLLKTKLSSVSAELADTRSRNRTSSWTEILPNGGQRPATKASPEYVEIPEPLTPKTNGRKMTYEMDVTSSEPAEESSTWNSIHAPKRLMASAPSFRPSSKIYGSLSSYKSPPSPTPSTVSLAPTVDCDGWWS